MALNRVVNSGVVTLTTAGQHYDIWSASDFPTGVTEIQWGYLQNTGANDIWVGKDTINGAVKEGIKLATDDKLPLLRVYWDGFQAVDETGGSTISWLIVA